MTHSRSYAKENATSRNSWWNHMSHTSLTCYERVTRLESLVTRRHWSLDEWLDKSLTTEISQVADLTRTSLSTRVTRDSTSPVTRQVIDLSRTSHSLLKSHKSLTCHEQVTRLESLVTPRHQSLDKWLTCHEHVTDYWNLTSRWLVTNKSLDSSHSWLHVTSHSTSTSDWLVTNKSLTTEIWQVADLSRPGLWTRVTRDSTSPVTRQVIDLSRTCHWLLKSHKSLTCHEQVTRLDVTSHSTSDWLLTNKSHWLVTNMSLTTEISQVAH